MEILDLVFLALFLTCLILAGVGIEKPAKYVFFILFFALPIFLLLLIFYMALFKGEWLVLWVIILPLLILTTSYPAVEDIVDSIIIFFKNKIKSMGIYDPVKKNKKSREDIERNKEDSIDFFGIPGLNQMNSEELFDAISKKIKEDDHLKDKGDDKTL